MKKYLLMGLAVGVGSTAFAQGSTSGPSGFTPQKINAAAAKQTVPYLKNQTVGGTYDSFETLVHNLGGQTYTPKGSAPTTKAFTTAVIGTTEYQNQTNSSICNRIVKSPDGTVSATWTMAHTSDWSDRGTGYNYYDGTTWMTPPATRVESVRTGFTNIGVTGTLGEVIVAHEASDLRVSKRAVKGTGAWTESSLGFPDVWSRLSIGGVAGQSLHVISQTTGVGTTPYMGQDGAIAYTRSQDGGVTWNKIRTVIPQIDSSFYLGFGGDAYSIDANGSTIAIVAGGLDHDVFLIKSTDDGNTWVKTIIRAFPIAKYDAAAAISDVDMDSDADTIDACDGSVNVLLDNSNNAHVFFGNMRVLDDDVAALMSYFPYTDGLMYWNETMGAAAPVMIAGVLDLNSDGIMNIYTDPTGATLGVGSFFRSLTSFPSSGIDAAGNLYVTYSSVFEGINDVGEGYETSTGTLIDPTNPGKSFRHQYVMRSSDNGVTWCPPIDLTSPDGSAAYDYIEGVYGAMAKDVDGFVHVISQEDPAPGHGVSTTTTPDPQATPAVADIKYFKVPVADLTCVISVEENSSVSEISLYPNPAANEVSLFVKAKQAAKASVKVYNLVGQEVAQLENNLASGNNTIKLNIASYKPGVYFVSTLVDGVNYSQKLIVQ
jgi:hypothetical protein